MFAAYMHSVRESVNKRMALVLIGMAVFFAVLIFFLIRVGTPSDGEQMMMLTEKVSGSLEHVVHGILAQEVQMTGVLWVLLAIFAAVPLQVSMLEKGWVELTLTKGVARWKVLLGHYFGGLTLYAATITIAMLPGALWLWAKTGISCKALFVAILIEVLIFASLMSLAALATLTQTGAAIPTILAVLVYFVSSILEFREQGLFQLITSHWGRTTVNGIYYILPKCSKLTAGSKDYVLNIIPNISRLSSPLWSTAAFTVVTMGLTAWLLHRKSL